MQLVARAKNMLLSPKTEWLVVAGESTDAKSLYTGYVLLLAALPPVCSFLSYALFFRRFNANVGVGVELAVVRYLLALAVVYILAIVASKIAPSFGGRDDMSQALKLIAYSATAAWVGGIFLLLPVLGILSLLMSLYSLYLLYVGVSPLMGVPAARVVPFTMAMILATVIVLAFMAYIAGPLLMLSAMRI